MKINYLTPFAEERVLSIEAYVNDLIQFQKNYSPKFEISKYIPKINKLYKLLPLIHIFIKQQYYCYNQLHCYINIK